MPRYAQYSRITFQYSGYAYLSPYCPQWLHNLLWGLTIFSLTIPRGLLMKWAGLTLWLATSITLIEVLNHHGFVSTFSCLVSQQSVSLTSTLYVIDCNLFLFLPASEPPEWTMQLFSRTLLSGKAAYKPWAVLFLRKFSWSILSHQKGVYSDSLKQHLCCPWTYISVSQMTFPTPICHSTELKEGVKVVGSFRPSMATLTLHYSHSKKLKNGRKFSNLTFCHVHYFRSLWSVYFGHLFIIPLVSPPSVPTKPMHHSVSCLYQVLTPAALMHKSPLLSSSLLCASQGPWSWAPSSLLGTEYKCSLTLLRTCKWFVYWGYPFAIILGIRTGDSYQMFWSPIQQVGLFSDRLVD